MNRLDTDHTSGSTGVARSFLDQLERWAAMDTSTNAPGFRAALLRHLREAQAAQPAMALIHQLAVRALDVASTGVARGDAVPDLRAHLAQSCAAEREDLAAQQAAVARTAAQLATMREPWIATLSSSSAVRDALLELQRKGKGPRVLVAESRPLNEGRALAAELAEAGIPTWLVVDAALPLLISQAAMVWIGADAVTDRGVLNKVGSYGVALAARESSVPVYALAMRRKFLPASTTALQIPEMPPAEVWNSPAPDVQPRNVYFELVPLELLRGVVVEDSVLGVTEIQVTAKDRELPKELAGGSETTAA